MGILIAQLNVRVSKLTPTPRTGHLTCPAPYSNEVMLLKISHSRAILYSWRV